MKKVTNITLAGIVFAVEEDAYEVLAGYLKSIEVQFAASPDYAEIAADIESAIAEKFRARKKNEKKAVTQDDVDSVIAQMGTAEEVSGEAEVGSAASAATASSNTPKKRLYRDTDDVIIAGVCSGIARYFDIDPVIVRLIFVLSIFFNGLGILAYIILWLVVPAAETTAQKYAMRGERMTVADITERVKKNLSDETNVERARGAWGSVRGFLAELFELLGRLLRWLFFALRYIIGVLFILIGGLGIAGLISMASALFFASGELVNPAMRDLANAVLVDSSGYVFVLAALASAFIPLLVLIMTGASMLIGRNLFTTAKSLTLFVTWIIALSVASTFGILYGTNIAANMDGSDRWYGDGQSRFGMLWDEEAGRFELHYNEEAMEEELSDVLDDMPSDMPFGTSVEIYDGIMVSQNIRRLDLSGRGLTGSLTAEIRMLQGLQSLDISDNAFTGLPAEVGQLQDLRSLDLSNNQFTGLPHELGNLTDLETLDLRGNDISPTDLEVIRNGLGPDTTILVDGN